MKSDHRHVFAVRSEAVAYAEVPQSMMFRGAAHGMTRIASLVWMLTNTATGHHTLVDTGAISLAPASGLQATQAHIAKTWSIDGQLGIEGALDRFGVSPDQIETVILTHLHADHVANLPKFRHARIVLSRRGWHNATSEKDPWFQKYPQDILHYIENEHAGPVELVDDEASPIPGIRLIWLGGHSPCSQGVVFNTAGQRIALAGDVIPMFRNIEQNIPTGHYENLREIRDGWERLKGISDVIIPSHDPDVPRYLQVNFP